MSEGFIPPPPEPRMLPTRHIAGVGCAWLFVVGIALLLIRWSVREYAPWAPAGFPPTLGVSEVADVNQRLFKREDAAPRLREAQRARLRGYGWVDRDAGVIHIPVEQALEQVLSTEEGARP
ncbi:hypothetical protein MXAN_3870 [Myxococcus xanthus DK 1622]|uniref:Uncharacterized protein n=1 Tax=Myxococcus xanthus (strain DK1622) TaxID=246197 RepID=Q1D5M3_MYXXD|nr:MULTISPECIES: hypothetical protein [Myxococcus]ABF91636.1 hypothetical protein MXAN_3870 [Myxococcus xanthus DK 1622]NOJ55135.1 hypothetical protein [Myxococcus xanthus]QPM76497.1 hypothetical protein I5Q59_19160 [Myxococcus xanthus]QVW65560.1 hypothetical protein JTM82_24505 [Myxococcus xanthus DZ2]QZZ51559.1 hypothetical protein MyxoNM_20370 [Myxococcus xanthus]